MTDLDRFAHAPWSSNYLQGIIEAPNRNLTPGTRLGVIYDEQLKALEETLKPVAEQLQKEIEAQQAAEDEQASQHILKTLNKAFREALITLPAEEYDWFELNSKQKRQVPGKPAQSSEVDEGARNYSNG